MLVKATLCLHTHLDAVNPRQAHHDDLMYSLHFIQ